jgi:hypothetical protein
VWQLTQDKGRARLRNMGPLAWDSVVVTGLLLGVMLLGLLANTQVSPHAGRVT